MGVRSTDWIAAADFIRVETIFDRGRTVVKVAYNPSSADKEKLWLR